MRLDALAFGAAAGVVAAVVFTLCVSLVSMVPGTMALAHTYMGTTDMSRMMTFGSFVGGLVIWTLGAAIVFGAMATIYNWLATRMAAAPRVAAGQDVPRAA